VAFPIGGEGFGGGGLVARVFCGGIALLGGGLFDLVGGGLDIIGGGLA